MNLLRRNAIANVAGRVATALLWLVVTPFVLEHLGAERFGIWALFFTFSGYLVALDLGMGSTMNRFIAAGRASVDRNGLARTLQRGLKLAFGLGLFWAVLIALGRGWIVDAFHVPAAMRSESLVALQIFAVGVFFLFPAQVLMGSLQGFERLDLSNLCMGLAAAAQVLTLYLGLVAGGGLQAAAWAGVVGQLVAGLVAAGLLRRELRGALAGERGTGPGWRELLHFGAALQLSGFLIVFQLQLGKILLGLLGNLAMVADYEIAFRVVGGVASVPLLILAAVTPTVARAWESEGPAAVGPIFTSTLRWFYIQSVLALGFLWLVAEDITHVWLGPGHERITFLIRLWAVACAVNFTWSPGAVVARGIGRPWIEVWSLAACVLANAALGIWWVPRYGAGGAMFALGVSYAAGFVTFFLASRRSGIPFGPWIRRELLPRLVVGWSAVALCSLLLGAGRVSRQLPGPGWAHGAIAGFAFLAVFALFFASIGDSQRLTRLMAELMRGPLGWLRRSPAR